MMEKKILVADIETTGFLWQEGSIVEIGIVELNLNTGDCEIIFESLCKEEILNSKHRKSPLGWIFDNSTLTVEDVRKAPRFEDIKESVQDIISGCKLGCTAFNRSFDIDFLKSRDIKFHLLQPCPMQLCINILKLDPTEKMKKWKMNIKYKTPNAEEAYNFFFPGENYVEMHRAPDDAWHEAKVVYELYKKGVFKLFSINK